MRIADAIRERCGKSAFWIAYIRRQLAAFPVHEHIAQQVLVMSRSLIDEIIEAFPQIVPEFGPDTLDRAFGF